MASNERLPKPIFAAKYPYNKVTVTYSGHEFHVDDTPGAERIRTAHKSGSFFEISPDGQKVELIVGNHYQYVKGGLTLTIDNNGDVLVSGNARLVVNGDMQAEVHGDLNSVVKGKSTIATLGDAITMCAGDSYTKVKGSMHTQVDGNMNADVKGSLETSVSGSASVTSKGNVDIEGSSVRIQAKSSIVLRAPSISQVKGI